MTRILFVEKEERTRALLQCRLAGIAKVKSAPCMDVAWDKLISRKFDLILWNTTSDPAGQINLDETLNLLAGKRLDSRIVVLTNSIRTEGLPPCCGGGIHIEHLPVNDEDLVSLVERNLVGTSRSSHGQPHADGIELPIEFEGIIAVSLPMRSVVRRVMDAAAVDIPVLITGETGTGKDLVAAAIHRRSRRKNRPYVAVNMGAMARDLVASEIFGHERGAYTDAQNTRPGIFEQANGGTVFLDEIATMDEKTQISLLRVLEEKNFRRVGGTRNIGADVRVIAATNEDLEKSVADKRFREDLFYRFNVFPIRVPPLRERISAITALTNHFVSRYSATYGKEVECVSPESYRLLRRYSWPGNVRELKNVIQAAVLMVTGKELLPEFIPERIREPAGRSENHGHSICSFQVGATLHGVENEFIRMTLAHVGGNKKLAASILGISRRALYNKIRKQQMS